MYVSMYECIYGWMDVCMHICMYIHTYIHTYEYMCVCMYVYKYICVYLFVFLHEGHTDDVMFTCLGLFLLFFPGDIGGSMGLFVGASVLTVFEIFDLVVHQSIYRVTHAYI